MTSDTPMTARSTEAAARVTHAAAAEQQAADKNRSALEAMNKSVAALRRLVVLLGALVCMLGVGTAASGLVAVRNANSTVELCALRVESLRDTAGSRRAQAAKILPGPNFAERRNLLLAAAHDLDTQAEVARCEQRFRFP